MKRSAFALVVLLAVAVAAPAHAGSAEFGVGGFAGYNTYSMNDVNDMFSGSGVDNISNGIGYGGGLRVRTSPSLLLALDYERLNGSTSGSGTNGSLSYDVDFKMPANAFVVGATYNFPSASKARFGVTGGVGYYMAKGNGTITLDDGVNNITLTGDVTGNGIGFHGGGSLDVAMSPVAHFEAMAGYRVAKTGDLEDSDGTKIDNVSAEWTGFMSRAGFSFFFGNH